MLTLSSSWILVAVLAVLIGSMSPSRRRARVHVEARGRRRRH